MARTYGGLEMGQGSYLLDGLKVFVDGKEILPFASWRNKKAGKALIYLLLTPKHRMPYDYLFYLLWPKRRYNRKTKQCLFAIATTIRKNLGKSKLLTRKHDFYQLEGEVWTDLGEIESLLRLFDTTHDPSEKEEFLSRARELARGDLLPEFPYDRHIDEYRQYYNGLRKRLGMDYGLAFITNG